MIKYLEKILFEITVTQVQIYKLGASQTVNILDFVGYTVFCNYSTLPLYCKSREILCEKLAWRCCHKILLKKKEEEEKTVNLQDWAHTGCVC